MEGGREDERNIHARFAHLRFGRSEQFRPDPELMTFIGRPLLAVANPDTVEVMSTAVLKIIVVLRGTEEWKAWLDGLAAANGTSITTTVEQALEELADKLRVQKPPRRIP